MFLLLVDVLEAVETECGQFGSLKKCIVGQEGDSLGKVHLLLPLHIFPILCGVDVSEQLLPNSLILLLLPRQSLLPQVHITNFTLSTQLRFSLPFLLLSTSILVTGFPIYSSSLPMPYLYHINLLFCTFLDISPTFVVTLILSFFIQVLERHTQPINLLGRSFVSE